MLIPINLNDITEPKPVPNGRYNLQITNCEEARTKEKGLPQFRVSIGIEGHDDSPNLTHFVGLPNEGDEPNKSQFKALMLKRFLTLFGHPIPANGIDTEAICMSLVGAKATAEVTMSEPDDSGNVYNRLMVPKMRGEGDAKAGVGRVAPAPPKR